MGTLRQLAGRVWLYPHDPDPAKVKPSVAVIPGEHSSVVIDAGHSPSHARAIQAAIHAAGLPDARQLVYTHHHWDHVWGACAWPDVEIIGHRSSARLLEQEARRPWSHRHLADGIAANPKLEPSHRARAAAMPTFDGFRILPPHTEFDDRLTLPSGIELFHVDSQHCADATVVAIPDSGVLLLGDSIYPPAPPPPPTRRHLRPRPHPPPPHRLPPHHLLPRRPRPAAHRRRPAGPREFACTGCTVM